MISHEPIAPRLGGRRRLRVDVVRAFFAGVVGAAAMTALLALAWLLGLGDAGIAPAFGATMFKHDRVAVLDVATAAGHLVVGGAFALGYAWWFERRRIADWRQGAGVALVHGLLTNFVVGFMGGMSVMALDLGLPSLDPATVLMHILMLWLLPAYLLLDLLTLGAMGPATAGWIALHLIYGVIVGGLYRRSSVVKAS